MIKRALDVLASFTGLIIVSPILLVAMLLIWLQDFHSPLYVAPRVGKDHRNFNKVKLRSMIVRADSTGVDSTSADDSRVTRVGRFVRRFKLDELTQLWNVLLGHMSLVGPRPNVDREVALYSNEEERLLSVKPGITDFASIIFSDEGEILQGSEDPDLDYNRLIRPWKSRLGLLYIEKRTTPLDIALILLTALAMLSRARALRAVSRLLERLDAGPQLVRVALRVDSLRPSSPPGRTAVIQSRSAKA